MNKKQTYVVSTEAEHHKKKQAQTKEKESTNKCG